MAVTRYGPKCGHARAEGERFCRKCGAAVGSGETKLTPTPVVASGAGEATASLPPVDPASAALPPPPGAPSVVVPPVATAPQTPAPQGVQTPAPQGVQTPAPQAAHGPGRSLPVKPLVLMGGLLLVVSALLQWILGAGSATGFDVPVQALWDIEAADGPVKLGFVLVAIGAIGGGLSFVQRTSWLRRLCGSIGVAIVLAFAAQVYRVIDASGGSIGDVLTTIGVGVYVALADAVALQVSR